MTTTDHGRAVDVAVARAMGWVPAERKGWFTQPGYLLNLPNFSTDDATALRHVVPFIEETRGLAISIDIRREHGERVTRVRAYQQCEDGWVVGTGEARGDNALAAALCQVVRAVAGMGETA